MTSRLLKLVAGFALLSIVAWWPASRRPEFPIVQPQGTEQVSWDRLRTGLDAQSRWYEAAASQAVTVSLPKRSSVTPRRSSHRGYATTAECIAAVENGGDYGRSSNPSHFGRYQFSQSTWTAYGGNPDDWGDASPAEQDAVFANAMASGGESNWTPYDGC